MLQQWILWPAFMGLSLLLKQQKRPPVFENRYRFDYCLVKLYIRCQYHFASIVE